MPRDGKPVHIPLPEEVALSALLKVKPTADMPRPGAQKRRKPNKKAAAKKRK